MKHLNLSGKILKLKKNPETSGVSPLRGKDGLLYSDTNIQANIVNEQFKRAFTTEDTTTMPYKGQSPNPPCQK